MFRIQILSDVHLEVNGCAPVIVPVAANLALAGDIGDPFDKSYIDFLRYCANLFEHVFVIAGNHEFYNNDYHATIEQLHQICAKVERTIFLHNSVVRFGDIVICGTPLWSNISTRAFELMNDGNYVSYDGSMLTRGRYLALHRESVDFLESVISGAQATDRLIVITHHAPHGVMNGKYGENELSSGFATDLSRLFMPCVRVWISGHTHQSLCVQVGDLKLIANCHGYDSEERTVSPINYVDV